MSSRGKGLLLAVGGDDRSGEEFMRDIHPEQAPYWLGGLIEAISVDGGPTDEQLRLIQALLRGYFGFEEAIDLVPLSPGDLARRIPDPSSRLRLVQSLIVLEF